MRLLLFRVLVIFAFAFIPVPCSSSKHALSGKKDVPPYEFGLATAKTGEERYQVLLRTHRAAIAESVNVDYTGVDTIRIEIPTKPSRIPLTQNNDFRGCVFIIKNNVKNCWLFGIENASVPIEVDKSSIDAGIFTSMMSLKNGRFLLLIEDEKPWVLNRKGHNYGHMRKDILLVENGVARNSVTMPYNNVYSKPKCSYIKIGKEPLTFMNITIKRDPKCTFLTHIAYISGFDNVRISNVSLYTPKSELIDDRGIRIYNCTNVSFDNVHIDGTYSQPKHSGYGINLGNVWNFKATKLYGKANWGIFGNNNVNTVRIENSQINRFDIHCYGRDISFKNVYFFDLYNSYSSVYGTIWYDGCSFTNFVPVQIGGSYNAYVEHEVMIKDCVMNMTPKKNMIFKMGSINETVNARHELAEKCLPNVKIKNLVVNMMEGTEEFYVFYSKKTGEDVKSIGVSSINIDGLTINPSGEKSVKKMMLSNIEMGTKTPVDCRLKNVAVNNPQIKTLFGSCRQSMLLKTNIPVKGGKVNLQNTRCVNVE